MSNHTRKLPGFIMFPNSLITKLLLNGLTPYLLKSDLSYGGSAIARSILLTISLYVAAIRSYFAYNDIDIVSNKFKRKVRLPKCFREDEEPINAADIRKILILIIIED